MRVFKTKWFARYMRKEGLRDKKLAEAVREISNGLFDADYSGGMFKKRIARDGGGKSSGYRSIIAYKAEGKCVFFYIFSKNERDDLNEKEEKAFRSAAVVYLAMSDADIVIAKENRELLEVEYYEKEI